MQAEQSQESKLCRMFNARSETVHEKSVFGRLLSGKRCIVLLNGFYEWAQVKLFPCLCLLHFTDLYCTMFPACCIVRVGGQSPFPLCFTGSVGLYSLCKQLVLSRSKVYSF